MSSGIFSSDSASDSDLISDSTDGKESLVVGTPSLRSNYQGRVGRDVRILIAAIKIVSVAFVGF